MKGAPGTTKHLMCLIHVGAARAGAALGKPLGPQWAHGAQLLPPVSSAHLHGKVAKAAGASRNCGRKKLVQMCQLWRGAGHSRAA